MIKEQGRKYFSTQIPRGESLLIKTGNDDDYIELTFNGVKSNNFSEFSFKISENIIIEKLNRITRKVRTL